MTRVLAPVGPTQSEPRRRVLVAQLAQPVRASSPPRRGARACCSAATVLALVWANSPLSDSYDVAVAHRARRPHRRRGRSPRTCGHWVNDGLMVAVLLRRRPRGPPRAVDGRADRRGAASSCPALAALGGMLVPALLYLAINPAARRRTAGASSSATDTAFLLGALALVGPACPTQLRVFLLTLSIVDDIVAVSVIGVVYSDVDRPRRAGGRRRSCLVAHRAARPPAQVWRASVVRARRASCCGSPTVESGLHPTIAGMAAGLLDRRPAAEPRGGGARGSLFRAFRQSPLPERRLLGAARASSARSRSTSACRRCCTPGRATSIVPLFALANAGRRPPRRGARRRARLAGHLGRRRRPRRRQARRHRRGVARRGAARPRAPAAGVGSGPGRSAARRSRASASRSRCSSPTSRSTTASCRTRRRRACCSPPRSPRSLGWVVFQRARRSCAASAPPRCRWSSTGRSTPSATTSAGALDAPLTLVEYGDFECPFCGRATGMVSELPQRFGDDLRYVFRHLPLARRPPPRRARRPGGRGGGRPGRVLGDARPPVPPPGPARVRGPRRVRRRARARRRPVRPRPPRGTPAPRASGATSASAEASGARGTPTFFVGDRRHIGPYDAQTLAAELNALRSTSVGASP